MYLHENIDTLSENLEQNYEEVPRGYAWLESFDINKPYKLSEEQIIDAIKANPAGFIDKLHALFDIKTVAALSRSIGISSQTIAKWKSRPVKKVTKNTAKLLKQKINQKIAQILGLESAAAPQIKLKTNIKSRSIIEVNSMLNTQTYMLDVNLFRLTSHENIYIMHMNDKTFDICSDINVKDMLIVDQSCNSFCGNGYYVFKLYDIYFIRQLHLSLSERCVMVIDGANCTRLDDELAGAICAKVISIVKNFD